MIAYVATLNYDYLPAVVAPVAERQNPLANSMLLGSGPQPTTTIEYGEFTAHFAKIKKLASVPSLWPTDGEQPSAESLTWAQLILQQLFDQNLPPTRVVASAEGGAALCFVDGSRYADIESLNSGEILGVLTDERNKPVAWEIEPSAVGIARAVETIRDFIYAP